MKSIFEDKDRVCKHCGKHVDDECVSILTLALIQPMPGTDDKYYKGFFLDDGYIDLDDDILLCKECGEKIRNIILDKEE